MAIQTVNHADKVSVDTFAHNIGRKTHNATKVGIPNPFNSGRLINTISGVIEHPILKIPAYTFFEDESYVECRRCVII